MASIPSGMRSWKCPECGGEVLLSVTQLDPIACDACRGKTKSPTPAANSSVTTGTAGPLGIWQALPESTKLVIVAGAFVVGLLIGLMAGFAVGKAVAPSAPASTAVEHKTVPVIEKEEERPDPPGPGYKWVRGRVQKDGTRAPGHWAKDPFYKGDDGISPKKKSSSTSF